MTSFFAKSFRSRSAALFCLALVGFSVHATEARAAEGDAPAAVSGSRSKLLGLNKGRWGFGFGFPGGGNPLGAGYVGARYFLADNYALGGYLLFGNDSAAKSNSVGVAGKFTGYLAQADRVNLFWFGQLSFGKNGGKANKDKDDLLVGFGGGFGVEYALLKDFSISGEGGLSFNTLPDGENAMALGTSAVALNFYF